jgi:hypothetical protein
MRKIEKFSGFIGNRTRDLPACNIVPLKYYVRECNYDTVLYLNGGSTVKINASCEAVKRLNSRSVRAGMMGAEIHRYEVQPCL